MPGFSQSGLQKVVILGHKGRVLAANPSVLAILAPPAHRLTLCPINPNFQESRCQIQYRAEKSSSAFALGGWPSLTNSFIRIPQENCRCQLTVSLFAPSGCFVVSTLEPETSEKSG